MPDPATVIEQRIRDVLVATSPSVSVLKLFIKYRHGRPWRLIVIREEEQEVEIGDGIA